MSDTTELRWFADGSLPSAVTSWFTADGTRGTAEERRDVYRLDGRDDVGVKLRSREILELKVRQSIGDSKTLPGGLLGALEVWRKWSPAEQFVDLNHSTPWTEVGKHVRRRRFSTNGDEFDVSVGEPIPTNEAGCDVEVTAITVGDLDAWTLAFAAYGQLGTHWESMSTAWHVLRSSRLVVDPFLASLGRSCGYPEWLRRTERSPSSP